MEELVKKMKKMTTAQLLVKQGKSKGEELEAIEKVLELRGQITREKVEISEPKILTPAEEIVEDENIETVIEEKKSFSVENLPVEECFELKVGDKVSFTSAKNSKKAPGQQLVGVIKKFSFDEPSLKTWVTIKVENVGMFLKKLECLKLMKEN